MFQLAGEKIVSFGNVLWVILFGWVLYVGYALAAGIMALTIIGYPYGRNIIPSNIEAISK